MKLITYNVNGIRAVMSKDFVQWLKSVNPDIVCLQEIKATPDQVNVNEFIDLGYHLYWYPAQKKGYSGVAIFTKIKPKNVVYGCGIDKYDFEGRVLRIDLGNLKNQIGTITNPQMIVIDSNYLSTLPKNEMRSGLAEMLKHGLIFDYQYWNEFKNL